MNPEYDADRLKPIDNILEEDPRQNGFVHFDESINNFRPKNLTDHYNAIYEISLHENIPEEIKTKFDTARNLYVYAWFIYRFYPVAEHHALITLEYALREQFGDELRVKAKNKKKHTLFSLLKYAIEQGKIKSEDFQVWHDAAEFKARNRVQIAAIKEMNEKSLESIEIDESNIEILDEDRDWEYINTLKKNLPALRNNYAHGSTLLHSSVLGTFTIVKEIICSIYK